MTDYFKNIPEILYEGKESDNPLSFKYYNENQTVLGKNMKEHLRFATCYWHTFTWPGLDPFGGPTFERPWMNSNDPLKMAELKLETAFDFFTKIKTPFFCFHDRDIAPEGDNYKDSLNNLNHIVDLMEKKMQNTGIKLLWGTANSFSHKRYMAGSSTNPDPEVFAYIAAQVKDCMDITKRLGGSNYVIWGGREGYETLLNTDMKKEIDNLSRFLELIVEYKHKIEFNHEQYEEIFDYCDSKKIKCFASVWDIDSVDFMYRYTDMAKIPSALITNLNLCEYARFKNTRLLVSTGMSTEEEIETCVESCSPDVIFHTNSTYPSLVSELNLSYISWLNQNQ